MAELGLRERKKQQTRQKIVAVAVQLFDERGFDSVPVVEIARKAEVSEATVFNYFPTKEDLVYGEMTAYEDALIDAIRRRAQGISVIAAFGEFLLQPRGRLADGDPEALEFIVTVARIVAESPALQARELRAFDRATMALAEAIAADSTMDDAPLPWIVANALMGVNRAMKEAVHRRLLDGRGGGRIADEVVEEGRRALELLERGLEGYAQNPSVG